MSRIIRDHSSPNFGPRRPVAGSVAVKHLLLHYTGMKTAEEALTRLCGPDSGVSCHYLVFEDGTVYGLVDESARAWHAGVGFWQGVTDINSTSVGIEIVNPGHEFGYRAFPRAQMLALRDLARDILARHPIPPWRVLGHSDVAPMRKQDPGELFDWRWLAGEGIGLWPEPIAGADWDEARGREALARFGYDAAAPLDAILMAFCRHFRPWRLSAAGDGDIAARLRGLTALLP